jgi:hypothetical protein
MAITTEIYVLVSFLYILGKASECSITKICVEQDIQAQWEVIYENGSPEDASAAAHIRRAIICQASASGRVSAKQQPTKLGRSCGWCGAHI